MAQSYRWSLFVKYVSFWSTCLFITGCKRLEKSDRTQFLIFTSLFGFVSFRVRVFMCWSLHIIINDKKTRKLQKDTNIRIGPLVEKTPTSRCFLNWSACLFAKYPSKTRLSYITKLINLHSKYIKYLLKKI